MTYYHKNVFSCQRWFFSLLLTLLFFNTHLSAQITLSGTVTDDDGSPIPDVAVVIKWTTEVTTTDFDGNYTSTANSDHVLVLKVSDLQISKRPFPDYMEGSIIWWPLIRECPKVKKWEHTLLTRFKQKSSTPKVNNFKFHGVTFYFSAKLLLSLIFNEKI